MESEGGSSKYINLNNPLHLDQSDSERPPILFLDVSLGKEKTQRIVIHNGDNVDKIIEEFAIMFSLTEKKKSKLMSVVKKQLASYLHSIEEEDWKFKQ